jgi:hypothetical protein
MQKKLFAASLWAVACLTACGGATYRAREIVSPPPSIRGSVVSTLREAPTYSFSGPLEEMENFKKLDRISKLVAEICADEKNGINTRAKRAELKKLAREIKE